MKIIFRIQAIILIIFLLLTLLPSNIFASENNNANILNSNSDFYIPSSDYMYIAALDNPETNAVINTPSDTKSESPINWHKLLGWSTLGMMTVTIASGFIVPGDVHCGLAGATTGLAVVTCADGIYEYGGLISFADGDWHYNLHAFLGILATGGFITTLALADGEGHVATGIASGATFTVALGVIYFQ